MKARLLRLCAAVAVAAGLLYPAPRASAEYLTLSYDGASSGPGNPTVAFSLDGKSYTDFAVGPFYWHQNSVPPNANFPPPIATFCLEINATQPLPVTGTNTTFAVVLPSDATTIGNDSLKVAAITELYGRYYDDAWNDRTTFHGDEASVAFQLALWELVYDGAGGKNLDDGRFQAAGLGTYSTDAQTMLDGLNGDTSSFGTRFGNSELVALLAPADGAKTQDMIQDQITVRPVAPVPTPPALMLAGAGVLFLLGRARWLRTPVA